MMCGETTQPNSSSSFRGARSASPESITPVFAFSIQTSAQGVWIPGLREEAHPGMTVFNGAG
jgi:hypothetical protein